MDDSQMPKLQRQGKDGTKVGKEQKVDRLKPKTAVNPAVHLRELRVILHKIKQPETDEPNTQSVKATEKLNPAKQGKENKKKHKKKIIDFKDTVNAVVKTLAPYENKIKRVVKRGNDRLIKDGEDCKAKRNRPNLSRKKNV